MTDNPTPPRPFARHVPQPPEGMDFNTEVALRLGRVESEQMSMDREQRRQRDTLDAHEARLAEGEGRFKSIQSSLTRIEGAFLWTIKIVMGAVLMALLGAVLVKYSPTLHAAPAAAPARTP